VAHVLMIGSRLWVGKRACHAAALTAAAAVVAATNACRAALCKITLLDTWKVTRSCVRSDAVAKARWHVLVWFCTYCWSNLCWLLLQVLLVP
jgi:hypothetical protein